MINKIESKKGDVAVGSVIILFIGIIIGIVLIVAIFNEQTQMTDKNPVVNESISIATANNLGGFDVNTSLSNFSVANAQTEGTWQNISRCTVDGFTLGNASTLFTDTTDYVFYPNLGIVTLLNTTATSTSGTNDTLASYSYCQDGYNQDGAARSIAGLIGLFTAIVLLFWILEKLQIIDIFDR